MSAQQNNPYIAARRRRRRNRKSTLTSEVIAVVAVMLVIFIVVKISAANDSVIKPVDTASSDLTSVELPDDVPQQIVDYTGFTVSYNASVHMPNYVAWELNDRKLQSITSRKSNFETDVDVEGCASPDDYRRSGYDRGHMMPAADAKWSEQAMTESHLLTNICPQDHKLNGGAWATLEANCRQWAARDSAIIIICGPVLTDRLTRTIGQTNRIPVPERFFKVILAPYANPPRGIGFLMNNGTNNGGVQTAAVSIDQIESITGYDFFAKLPDEIENDVEAQCAYHEWQRKTR